jgi:hypothetical protein
MMGARVPETCRAEYEYKKVLIILKLLCIWLVFYSLLLSLMHGTMNLKNWWMCLGSDQCSMINMAVRYLVMALKRRNKAWCRSRQVFFMVEK